MILSLAAAVQCCVILMLLGVQTSLLASPQYGEDSLPIDREVINEFGGG